MKKYDLYFFDRHLITCYEALREGRCIMEYTDTMGGIGVQEQALQIT